MLLDDTPSMAGEKLSLSNINSLRSYDVIDEAKAALETACPGNILQLMNRNETAICTISPA